MSLENDNPVFKHQRSRFLKTTTFKRKSDPVHYYVQYEYENSFAFFFCLELEQKDHVSASVEANPLNVDLLSINWKKNTMLSQTLLKLISVKHMMFLLGKPGGQRANFTNHDLTGINVNGMNLASAIFRGAILHKAQFTGCDFTDVDAFCADFSDAVFIGCDLRRFDGRGAKFDQASLSACDLRSSDFRPGKSVNVADLTERKASFQGASLNDVYMSKAQLGQADFSRSSLSGISFVESELNTASFVGAEIVGCNFNESRLMNCSFQKAQVLGTAFLNCDLRAVNFEDARMAGVSFGGAKLDQAVLPASIDSGTHPEELRQIVDAHMEWMASGGYSGARANLAGRDLQGASFDGIDMSGVSFDGADLSGATFVKARLVLSSFHNARLDGAVFDSADCSGATFTATSLRGAKLRKAIFVPANLIGPDGAPTGRKIATSFAGADLRAADFSGADLRFARLIDTKMNSIKMNNARLDHAELPARPNS